MSSAEFEARVADALDSIPDELAALVQNCVVLVEDVPPAEEPSDLLGLYLGVPLTERSDFYAGALPDRILIFRQPLLAMAQSHAELVEQIRITVVHEIAHHFGVDDERLDELGYG